MPGEIAARVQRGESIEAVHNATVAVVDGNGKLTHYLGDPREVYMTRSSVKPFQAMPLILSGGFDHFGFNERQLAIMCASHNGTDEHAEVTLSSLRQAGNSPDDLRCGTQLPAFMRLNGEYPKHGEDKDPLRHNCSGKHSGFLALTKYLDEATDDYLNPDGKAQRMVRQAVADMCCYPMKKIAVGIDGCSAPVLGLPVHNLAIGFMHLATMSGEGGERHKTVARIRNAMTAHPYLISGEKRFDYDLMRSFDGRVVCKVGAEAIEAVGFSDPPLGICVKIVDGNTRALAPVVVEVLRQLGLVKNIEDYQYLLPHQKPKIRNYRGIEAAEILCDFTLRSVV